MNRVTAAIGSAIFFVVAPCVVAGLVPWLISGWRMRTPLPAYGLLAAAGAIIAVAGLALLIDSFVRFARDGIGTPAPVAPTQHLVVRGGYRFVRNPMYVAVVALIVAQALIFASLPLVIYGGVIWLTVHLFVVFYEEPTLRQSFGAEYDAFTAEVPRWLPRLTPAPQRHV